MDNLGTLWSSVSAHARTRLTAGFSLAKIIPATLNYPKPFSLLAQASERRQSPSAPRNASPLTQRHLAAADLIDQLLVAAAASKPSTDPAALMEPLAEPPAGRELSAVQIQQLWLAKQLREDALSVTSASTARTRSSRLYAATGEIFGKAAPTRAGFYGLALLSKLLSYSTRLPFWMARPSPSAHAGIHHHRGDRECRQRAAESEAHALLLLDRARPLPNLSREERQPDGSIRVIS